MPRLTFALICIFFSINVVAQSNGQTFISICYHNVRDVWDDNPTTVQTNHLINQLSWLKEHGYHPVSIQNIIDAHVGKKQLPDKAVLLTFDDGYINFYKKIYPVLKLFNYPAVFALVTSWLETPKGQMVHYGNQLKAREEFLSWEQVREMMASGLIEIASHTHNLHYGIRGNKQGNMEPAGVTRQYFSNKNRYETDANYQKRISEDLQRSVDILYKRTGKRPRVIVWPYGAYSKEVNKIAKFKGMPIAVGLDESVVNKVEDISLVQRVLIVDNPSLADYTYHLLHLGKTDPIRVAQVDLDYIYDKDPQQTNKNLGKLLDRIKAMRINTVYLQAFSDPDGDGNADALYFSNRHLPVRADLFDRVAWQLRTRARVRVYAWLPVLSFQAALPDEWWVHEWKNGQSIKSVNNYKRLSPFHSKARRFVTEIYEDLAKYNHFAGLLFHDDAFLTDFEDASPAAVEYTKGMNNKQKLQAKIDILTNFTMRLSDTVKYYRPEIKTARNLYANVIMQPASSEWFAQSYSNFLQHYDYVALMAMPYMEQAENPKLWFTELVDKVASFGSQALHQTVFELQTVDWRKRQKINDPVLAYQMDLLQQKNALNFGYYPDDFFHNHPPLLMLKEMMTLETFPFGI